MLAAMTGRFAPMPGASVSGRIYPADALASWSPALYLLGLTDWMARPVIISVRRTVDATTHPALGRLSDIFDVLCAAALSRLQRSLPCTPVLRQRSRRAGVGRPVALVADAEPAACGISTARLPMQILYLFLLMIPMTAVAAPITMAETVLYTFYGVGRASVGLTAQADQVLGGLIMWIRTGVYIMLVFGGIYFRWAQREDSGISSNQSQAHTNPRAAWGDRRFVIRDRATLTKSSFEHPLKCRRAENNRVVQSAPLLYLARIQSLICFARAGAACAGRVHQGGAGGATQREYADGRMCYSGQ